MGTDTGTGMTGSGTTRVTRQRPWRIALLLVALWAFSSDVTAQVLDLACDITAGSDIDLTWTNPLTYDSIDISLDGAPATTVPGTATSAVIPIGTGIHELCVIAIIGGVPQPAACCAVALPDVSVVTAPGLVIGQAADPTNPNPVNSDLVVTNSLAIGDLQVRVEIAHVFRGDLEVRLTSPTGVTLTLANNDGGAEDDIRTTFADAGAPYDGAELADESWLMPEGPGTLADFAGADSAGTWSLSIDDTFADLDDGVLEEWELLVFAGGVALPIEVLGCVMSPSEPDRALLTWVNPSPYDSIEVEIDGAIVATLPGDATTFLAPPQAGLTTFCLRPALGGSAVPVTCCSLVVGVPPIVDLTCTVIAGSGVVEVEWTNPATYYDSIEIEVGGMVVETLFGDDVSTAWPIAALETVSICVRPVAGAAAASPSCCTTTAPTDTTDASVVVAAELIDGFVDSTTSLTTALVAAGETVVVVGEIDPTSIGTPRAIWVMLGTFPQNHTLTAAEGQLLFDWINAGIPVYVEGGDVWGFDDPTAFALVDGVAADATDGDDTFQGMIGLDYGDARFAGLVSGYGNDAGSGNDWIDQLSASTSDDLGPNAGEVWIDDGSGGSVDAYATGIFYETSDPAGPVLCQSWEFGGYGGDATDLAARYRVALGLAATPTFRRGDTNSDGAVDVADAVFLLDALFTLGMFPTCPDAADVNDDGAIDVSDAVYELSYLFSGAAAPPAPGVDNCGVDPTADALRCPPACL